MPEGQAPHVVVLTPGFPADVADETCIPAIRTWVEGLRAARPHWDITVLALQYPFIRMEYWMGGVRVIALGGRNRGWARPLAFARAAAAFRSLHRDRPVSVIHSMWLTEAALAGRWLSARYSVPQVTTVAGQDAGADNRWLRWVDAGAAGAVALSARSAAVLERSSGFRAPVIPIGIAAAEIGGEPLAGRDLDLLSVGSLIPLKRHARFVELVHRLRPSFPHIRAAIIGTGPEEGRLRAQIARLGLAAQVRLLGRVTRAELLGWMGRARVFVQCSEQEGMGYVLLEALARGAHAVSLPVGIAAESRKCRVVEMADPARADAPGPETEAMYAQLVAHTARFLREPVDAAPEVPFGLAETVEAYLRLPAYCGGAAGRGVTG